MNFPVVYIFIGAVLMVVSFRAAFWLQMRRLRRLGVERSVVFSDPMHQMFVLSPRAPVGHPEMPGSQCAHEWAKCMFDNCRQMAEKGSYEERPCWWRVYTKADVERGGKSHGTAWI